MRLLFIAILSAVTFESTASTLNCYKDKFGKKLVVSYLISDNPSRRLASDIVNRGIAYSSGQVAQYKATNHEHFVVVDDPETASFPLFILQAYGIRKKTFFGQLITYENSKPKVKEKLYCFLK